MPLLFNKGKSNFRKEGRSVKCDDSIRSRWQRKKLLETLAKKSSPAKKAEQEQIKIETIPFDEIKDINPINPSAYSNLSNYIKKNISPSESVEEAVLNFMVNMFLNLPDNFYQPGKNYSRMERKFTKEQLNVFRNSLSALEIMCGKYNFGNSIGNFSNKQTYKLEKLSDILNTEIWNGNGRYHTIYASHPSNIVPTEFDESLLKHFLSSDELNISNKLQEYLTKKENSPESKALEGFYKWLDEEKKITELESLDVTLISKLSGEYVDKHNDLKVNEKRLICSMCEVIELFIKCGARIPDEKAIITRITNNLDEKGVLILEGSEIKEIPGLRIIDSYNNNVSLYQKI